MFANIFALTQEQVGLRKYNVLKILGIKFKKHIDTNSIYLVKNGVRKKVKRVKGVEILFNGDNSVVEIGYDPIADFQNCQISCGNNGVVRIGSSAKSIRKMSINSNAEGSKITIGKDFSSQSMVIINENEPNLSIEIGDDCMFSNNVYIRPTDAHTIYDIKTGAVLNPPSDIKIGNHVWSNRDVKFLKGANVPDGFIVGANSIVTKNSVKTETLSMTGGVLVGTPAKIVKTGCTWSRLSTHHYLEEKQRGGVNE